MNKPSLKPCDLQSITVVMKLARVGSDPGQYNTSRCVVLATPSLISLMVQHQIISHE